MTFQQDLFGTKAIARHRNAPRSPKGAGVQRAELLERLEESRVEGTAALDPKKRGKLGQYMSPVAVASLMAEMFDNFGADVRILDPGAGTGALSVMAVLRALASPGRERRRIQVVAYEISDVLAEHLKSNLERVRAHAHDLGVQLDWEVRQTDFLAHGTELVRSGASRSFTHVIANPPYAKINTNSPERRLLRSIGLETSNLYSGFAGVAIELAQPGAEIVMITPRSYANGPYFRPFREFLLERVQPRRLHVFERRNAAFKDDAVLQENVILSASVGGAPPSHIVLSQSSGEPGDAGVAREVPFERVVAPNDPQCFVRLELDGEDFAVAEAMRALPSALTDLGLQVSTGRVVDFRAQEALRKDPAPGTVPLLYPCHMANGAIVWPVDGKKPNAIVADDSTSSLLVPAGSYVLVKRFSSKEERRRIVACVCGDVDGAAQLGFENHLNYFHAQGAGMEPLLARGLALYLNSTFADKSFRAWSGHTQVNATDLRSFRFPSKKTLRALGRRCEDVMPKQEEIDAAIEELVLRRL